MNSDERFLLSIGGGREILAERRRRARRVAFSPAVARRMRMMQRRDNSNNGDDDDAKSGGDDDAVRLPDQWRPQLVGRRQGQERKTQRKTPEEIRAGLRKLLGKILSNNTQLADEIEAKLFSVSGSSISSTYKRRGRALAQDLRSNAALRDLLVKELVSVADVVRGDVDTAAPEVQDARARAERLRLSRHLLSESAVGGVPTTEYVCPNCKSTNATFLMSGGQRDVGRTETWGSSSASVGLMRLRCTDCHHKWIKEL